jgi:hypothetical protein
LLLAICAFVPLVFPVEISKDTVVVNDIDFSSCWQSGAGTDTLALWNIVNSPIALDTIDIIINPSKDGLFRTTNCRETYADTNAPDRIQIAVGTYKNELAWIESPPLYNPLNRQYRVYAKEYFDTAFASLLSFNGSDTCFIYGILIADCFRCVGMPRFLMDFQRK